MSNIIKSFRVIEGNVIYEEKEEKSEIINKQLVEETKRKYEEIISKAKLKAEEIINSAYKEYEEHLNSAYEKSKSIYDENKQSGYEEGYKAGKEEGFNKGYEDGFQKGENEAQKLIDEALEIKNEYINRRNSLLKEAEEDIVNLIITIYEKVLYKRVEEDRDLILSLVLNGIKDLEIKDKLTIIVSKDDYEVIEENKKHILAKATLIDDIEIRVDNDMVKGDCILETSKGDVDVSINNQLKEIKELIVSILNNEWWNMEEKVNIQKYIEQIREKRFIKFIGNITKVTGLTIESNGPMASIGELCYIYPHNKAKPVLAEVVGFKDDNILLMPLGHMEGIASGSKVIASGKTLKVHVGEELKGRILDGLGNPIDGKGPIPSKKTYDVSNTPPNPLERQVIKEPLTLGVKAIDGLLTFGKGQRMGIFAGSGVGKSTLMGMIARNSSADINVIGLIGERGREVREFIEKDLREEGLKRSIVVVATSDQPALIRVKGAMVATAIAEYFRDLGKDVMLLMDSVTRFAMAQREIGLAIGEPPVTRGFTPSVFSVLPKLLERAGTSSKGSITGLYTVLVDGDDLNEPITDTVRGILDGHIVLSRKLANQNHYPAIDVLASVSRVMPSIVDDEHLNIANTIKNTMAVYRESEDLINIGAYKKGSNREIDKAIDVKEDIDRFLKQRVLESYPLNETIEFMMNIANKLNS